MPEPIDSYSMQPLDAGLEPLQHQLAEETRRRVADSGATGATGAGNVIEIVGDVVNAAAGSADVAGAVFETVVSSAEVGGHVLSGALEALGSAGDALGALDGCSGCSVGIAFFVALASGASALAVRLL